MRNKGIVIELTALLDVILIMLFWVMMSMEKNNEKVRTDAANTVAEYEQKYEDSQRDLNDLQKEADILRSEFDRLLTATSDSVAAANQKALDGFANGTALFLKIRYDGSTPVMYIYSGRSELAHSPISSEQDASALIISNIKKLGLTDKDTILCTFAFAGNETSRFDTQAVRNAMNSVKSQYSRFYWAETSISN